MPAKEITAIGLSGVVSAGAAFAVLDSRYAQATDVQALTAQITAARIDSLEEQMREAEKDIRLYELTPESERTPWLEHVYIEAKDRKQRIGRKLERLNVGMEQ